MFQLTEIPIPNLSEKQLSAFTKDSILSKKAYQFNVQEIENKLQEKAGTKICVFDIGATAIKAAILKVNPDNSIDVEKNLGQEEKKDKGENYLPFILKIREKISGLPVGISYGGPVNDRGEMDVMPHFPQFYTDVKNKGGFKLLLNKQVTFLNDAVCLALASYYNVIKINSKVKQVIVVINGGGIGGAVVNHESQIFSCEPGHLPIDGLLNPYGVRDHCGLIAGDKTCLIQVGSIGTGIESQWQILKNKQLNGEEIGKLIATDETALILFANSALIIAHVIEGLRKVHNIPLENTAIICHGGAFKVNGYIERARQILGKYYHEKFQNDKPLFLKTTKDLGFDNACMIGAAIATTLT